MSVDIILVNLIALLLIIFVLWWFFGSKTKAKRMDANLPITILVKDGVYQPARIAVPAGKEIKLQFVRSDAAPCAEYVVFSKLNTSYRLPLNQKVEVTLPPLSESELDFTCQMGMYRGKIIVGS